MTEQTIEQLQEQNDLIIGLARRANIKLTRDLRQARLELAHAKIRANKFDAALTDACAARDALARECNQLEEDREYNAALVTERDVELVQARAELAQLRRQLAVPAQRCGYCDYRYSAGTNEVNFAVLAEHIKSCPGHPLSKALAELVQAHEELAQVHENNGYSAGILRETNAKLAQALTSIRAELAIIDEALGEFSRVDTVDHGVYLMSAALDDSEADFAMTAQSLAQARAELKDLRGTNGTLRRQVEQSTSNRDYWFEACKATEIERDQIRKEAQEQSDLIRKLRQVTVAEEAAIVEAAEVLIEQSYPGIARTDPAAVQTNIARGKLKEALEYRSEAATKLQERLAALERDREEASRHVEQLQGELGKLTYHSDRLFDKAGGLERERDACAAKLDAAEAALVDCAQALLAERQLRREAEQRAEGALATARKRATRMGEAERRANKAVNQLSRAGERERQSEQRAKRAETLAALVNEETAELLERLAWHIDSRSAASSSKATCTARELTAQIRETLSEH